MNTTYTISTVGELIDTCNRRTYFYRDLINRTKDDLCNAIISRFINQSEIFLEEIIQNQPGDISETFTNSGYKHISIDDSSSTELSRLAFFKLSEENEKVFIDSYSDFLENNTSVLLDLVVSQQLEDIKYCYQRILALKQACLANKKPIIGTTTHFP